jgi:hypothetical protein
MPIMKRRPMLLNKLTGCRKIIYTICYQITSDTGSHLSLIGAVFLKFRIFAVMFKKPLQLYTGLVFFAGCLILWIFRSHQQFADGLSNALSAKEGRDLFNPHDMILPSVIHVLYKIALIFNRHADVLDIAAFHNTIMAGITLSAIFLLLYKATARFLPGVAAAGALMLTGGFWLFVPLVEVYVPSQGWLALASVILLYRPYSIYNTWKWVSVSVCIIGAALYHQTGVLFIVPLALYTLMMVYPHKWGTWFKIVGLSLISNAVTFYLFSKPSFKRFVKYCIDVAQNKLFNLVACNLESVCKLEHL